MQFEPYIAVLSAIVITTGDRGQIDFPLSGMMSQNAVYLPPSSGGKRRERERERGGGGERGEREAEEGVGALRAPPTRKYFFFF